MLKEIRRLIAKLTHSQASDAVSESSFAPATTFEFDPMWHGDHWQNLLSCPMDARHYVMEDWSVAAPTDWDHPDHVAAH